MNVEGEQTRRDVLRADPGAHPIGDLVQPLAVGGEGQVIEHLAHRPFPPDF